MKKFVLISLILLSGCAGIRYCRPDEIHNKNCRPMTPQDTAGAVSRGFSIKGVWEW